jgi:hypothetical protein
MTAAQGRSVAIEGKIWSNNQGGVVLMLKSGDWQRRFIVGEVKEPAPAEPPPGDELTEAEASRLALAYAAKVGQPLSPLDVSLRDFFDILLDEASTAFDAQEADGE